MKLRRTIGLLAAAMTAMLVVAPIASAKSDHHGGKGWHRALCGTVDATSTLPTTIVIAKRHGMLVTVQNTNNVAVDAAIVPGSMVCARVDRVAATDYAAASLVLVSIKLFTPHVRPYAVVTAHGVAHINGMTITVGTVDFTEPADFVLPPDVVDGATVNVFATIAAAGGAPTIVRINTRSQVGDDDGDDDEQGKGGQGQNGQGQNGHGNGRGHRSHHLDRGGHHRGSWMMFDSTTEWVAVVGPITAVVQPGDYAAGSVSVAGIMFAVPAGMTLDPSVVVDAGACAFGTVDPTAGLTLTRVHVRAALVMHD